MVRSLVKTGALPYRIVAGIVLLLLSSGCGGKYDLSALKIPGLPVLDRSSSELTMPDGWDDIYLTGLERGKNPKTTVAVTDFVRNQGIPSDIDIKLEDMLITSLVQTGKLDVVDRAKLERVLEEQERTHRQSNPGTYQARRIFDAETAPALGKLVGAQGVVYGTVVSATESLDDKFAYDLKRFEVEISVHAVDTTSGKIFLSEKATGTFEAEIITTARGTVVAGAVQPRSAYTNAAKQAVDSIAGKIARHYPLLGRVVDLRDDKIYLDVGEARGGKRGDRFIVFRKGGAIIQPGSALHLGWEKEVIAEVKVASSEKNMSVARLVKLVNSQVPLKPGDFAISAVSKEP